MVARNYSVSAPITWLAIAAAEISAGIHISLAPDHIHEKFYVGVLFCIGSALLTAAALGLAARGGRTLIGTALSWVTAGGVSLGMVGGYFASRTVGLPLGYQEGFSTSTENILGYVSIAVEVVAVACAVVALARMARATRRPEPNVVVDSAGAHFADGVRTPADQFRG